MNRATFILTLTFLSLLTTSCVSREIETMKFKLITKSEPFELRDYSSYLVAETEVSGDLEDAGNKAFRPLFNYISGANRTKASIAMTSPVTQEPTSEKIAMTAPVGQTATDKGWIVSFTMPSEYTMETLPTPESNKVTLREVPAKRMASVTYSGGWGENLYKKNLKKLEAWISEQGYKVLSKPMWARYNSPMTLWFLRRNEILIEVEKTEN